MGSFFFGKYDQKLRDCPYMAVRRSEAYRVSPDALDVVAPKRVHFYYLKVKANADEDRGMVWFSYLS